MRTLAFAETLRDITWCKSVGFYYDTKCSQGNPSLVMTECPIPELGAFKEMHMLQMAASDDRKELLKLLDVWIKKHECSGQKCGGPQKQGENPPLCIATQILEKRNKQKKNGGSCIGVGKHSIVDHTAVLLNINSKALENGQLIGAGATSPWWRRHGWGLSTQRRISIWITRFFSEMRPMRCQSSLIHTW